MMYWYIIFLFIYISHLVIRQLKSLTNLLGKINRKGIGQMGVINNGIILLYSGVFQVPCAYNDICRNESSEVLRIYGRQGRENHVLEVQTYTIVRPCIIVIEVQLMMSELSRPLEVQ